MKLSKILQWLAIAFVIWFVVEQSTSAGHIVHNAGTLLSTMATGFAHFITSI